jgi:hypothetical protein
VCLHEPVHLDSSGLVFHVEPFSQCEDEKPPYFKLFHVEHCLAKVLDSSTGCGLFHVKHLAL